MNVYLQCDSLDAHLSTHYSTIQNKLTLLPFPPNEHETYVVNFLTVHMVLYYSKNKLFEMRSNLKSSLHYCNLLTQSFLTVYKHVYKPNKNAML